jgi:hypothetical protein
VAKYTSYQARPGFDEVLAGKLAECDGGTPAPTGGGTREEFSGRLTGEYVDHGDPPWRWYRMIDLVKKPAGYDFDSVWCESNNVFVTEEQS